MLTRLRCRIFGCRYDNGQCRRCEAEVYDWDYFHVGAIGNPVGAWLWFRSSWLPKRCRVCRKWFLPRGIPAAQWCSDECDANDTDIPF